MKKNSALDTYRQQVENKYNVYNNLFMNLPYEKVDNIGMLLPLLHKDCADGLKIGKSPLEIINAFFDQHTKIVTEEDKIDFFFRVIQYVERQVVLFDSAEDAGFTKVQAAKGSFALIDTIKNQVDVDQRKKVIAKLSDFSVRLVFTAHPTQFYPLSVLDIIKDLRESIQHNDLDHIDVLLQQLGMTSFLNEDKPTPVEEAYNIIYYLRYVYYDAISKMYSEIKEATGGQLDNPNLIRIGFWPGGDRDGNPFVTSKTTLKVADTLRTTLMKCYYNDIKALQRKLTFRGIADKIATLKNSLYDAMFDPQHYLREHDLLQPFVEIRKLLIEKFNGIYLDEIDAFIDKINIFKTHFASIDIRQDHRKHYAAIESIVDKYSLGDKPWAEMNLAEQKQVLLNSSCSANPDDFEEAITKDTIRNIRNLKVIQQKNGEQGCNRYIISNSEDVQSVLFVYALFRWCDWKEEEINFDIVPLFETMIGMNASEEIMNALFELPAYRNHVQRRGNIQNIMLGFSDGTKDGGYLKANYAIYHTKESLTAVCNNYNIKPIFFDGRGGPPARGGGKTQRFYASQGDKIANNEIQLTIQGQTITSTFGTKEQFTYNIEQMIGAGLSSILGKQVGSMSAEQRRLIGELSELSFAKYDALKHHERFISYLEEMSTLKYYGKANIGSRPGKRGNTKELTLDDLRAISFVGSWSQLKQNVPGYFGIGTALSSLKDAGRLHEVVTLFNEEPFFKALMLNSMMSMTKCYFPLTSYMQDNEKYAEFWNILHDEYQLSVAMLLEISGYDQLMEEEQVSRTSIQIREQIVLPLLSIQQYALQMIGSPDQSRRASYEKIVTRSLYGNINASRNSA